MRQEGSARVSPTAPGGGDTPRIRSEAGDIVTGWLGQLVVFMTVIALLAYELLTVGLAAISVDDAAIQIARTGALTYDGPRDLERLEQEAATEAARVDVELVAVEIDGDELVISVRRQAATLWAHRIPPLADLTRPSGTARADWTTR